MSQKQERRLFGRRTEANKKQAWETRAGSRKGE